MQKETRVTIKFSVKKQLKKLPNYIVSNLKTWVESVVTDGIEEVRKISSYHDEPLKGKRRG